MLVALRGCRSKADISRRLSICPSTREGCRCKLICGNDGAVSRKQFTRSEYFERSPLSLSSLSLPPFLSPFLSASSLTTSSQVRNARYVSLVPGLFLFFPLLIFHHLSRDDVFFRINTLVPKARSTLSTVTSQCRRREVVPHPFSLPSSLPPVPRQFPSQYAVANF